MSLSNMTTESAGFECSGPQTTRTAMIKHFVDFR